ncbi:hypothetical protein D3C78_1715070 [compost metagenome]
MLKRVGIEVARVEGGIGELIVVELDELDGEAVPGGNLLDDIKDLLCSADGDADGNGVLVFSVRRRGEGDGKC